MADEPEVIPPPPPSNTPTQENLDQWQNRAQSLEASLTALQRELADLKANNTPASALDPLKAEIAALRSELSEAKQAQQAMQTQLQEAQRQRNADDRPAPQPAPKRNRSPFL